MHGKNKIWVKTMYQNISFETKDKIAFVIINRPEKLNALNNQTMLELKDVFMKIKLDDNIYAVILTGAGDKAFVAGADIAELNKLDAISGREFAEIGQEVFNLIENLDKPVIAAVNGYALGGGSELAWACHFRIASENAIFGQPEIDLGIIPGYGGTQRLTRLIGKTKALELILTGRRFSAKEAYEMGLVNKVVSQSELLKEAEEFAKTLVAKPQIAVRMAIKAINSAFETTLSEGLRLESALFGICCGTEDFKEGTSAFLEKRKPTFKNK